MVQPNPAGGPTSSSVPVVIRQQPVHPLRHCTETMRGRTTLQPPNASPRMISTQRAIMYVPAVGTVVVNVQRLTQLVVPCSCFWGFSPNCLTSG